LWSDAVTVKKGDYAEDIVRSIAEQYGYIVYRPVGDKAHAIDGFAVKFAPKDLIIIGIECKAKSRRNFYEDTGFNYSNFLIYKKIQEKYKIEVFIFFIDEHLAEIYGNFLKELSKKCVVNGLKYPRVETCRGKKIIFFPISNMIRNIFSLDTKKVEVLKKFSSRNYEYNEMKD